MTMGHIPLYLHTCVLWYIVCGPALSNPGSQGPEDLGPVPARGLNRINEDVVRRIWYVAYIA